MKRSYLVPLAILALGTPALRADDHPATAPAPSGQVENKDAPPKKSAPDNKDAPDERVDDKPAPAQAVNHLAVRPIRMVQGGQMNVDQMVKMQQQGMANQKNWIERVQLMPDPCKAGELVHIRMANGFLDIDPGSYDYRAGNFRVKVQGTDAIWIVNTSLSGKSPVWHGHGDSFVVNRYDFDQNQLGQIYNCQINMGYPMTVQGSGVGISVVYQQLQGQATLTVSELGADPNNPMNFGQAVNLREPTLVELIARHPAETRKYLRPILTRLAMRELMQPGPADVYTAFPDLSIDAPSNKALQDLLPQLDADDLAVRDAASKKLETLGAGGVGAAMHLDPQALTAEQQTRIDAFIDSQRRWPAQDAQKFRKDLSFLIGCLQFDDPQIVTAATKAIEQLVGHPVQVDQNKDAVKRQLALEDLNAKLQAELDAKNPKPAPRTQPVQTQPLPPQAAPEKPQIQLRMLPKTAD